MLVRRVVGLFGYSVRVQALRESPPKIVEHSSINTALKTYLLEIYFLVKS